MMPCGGDGPLKTALLQRARVIKFLCAASSAIFASIRRTSVFGVSVRSALYDPSRRAAALGVRALAAGREAVSDRVAEQTQRLLQMSSALIRLFQK